MQTLFALVALVFFASLAGCAANEGAEVDGPSKAGEWQTLFDGTDPSTHWRGFRKDEFPAGWVVEDDCLVMRGGGGDLVTREEFRDFELSLEWRVVEAGNSGVFFHVDEQHDYVWQSGPEMQVLDDERHPDGQNPKTSAGSNYALHAPSARAVRPAGEWNTARLIVDGDRVEHWLNGTRIVDYRRWNDEWEALVAASKFANMPDYGRNSSGRIALQDHGDLVWFRNLKIRRL